MYVKGNHIGLHKAEQHLPMHETKRTASKHCKAWLRNLQVMMHRVKRAHSLFVERIRPATIIEHYKCKQHLLLLNVIALKIELICFIVKLNSRERQ